MCYAHPATPTLMGKALISVLESYLFHRGGGTCMFVQFVSSTWRLDTASSSRGTASSHTSSRVRPFQRLSAAIARDGTLAEDVADGHGRVGHHGHAHSDADRKLSMLEGVDCANNKRPFCRPSPILQALGFECVALPDWDSTDRRAIADLNGEQTHIADVVSLHDAVAKYIAIELRQQSG